VGGGIVITLVSTSSSFSTGGLRRRFSTLSRVSCESFVQVRATSKIQASDTTGTSAFVPEEAVVHRRPFAQLCVYCQRVFDDWAVVVHTLQKEPKSGSLPSYRVEHLDSLGELKLSAAAGCNLCEQFINSANKGTRCRVKRQLGIQKCNYPHTLEDWNLTLMVRWDETSGKGPDEVNTETLYYAICSLSLYSTPRQGNFYLSRPLPVTNSFASHSIDVRIRR
jgi:hypothetical protein